MRVDNCEVVIVTSVHHYMHIYKVTKKCGPLFEGYYFFIKVFHLP